MAMQAQQIQDQSRVEVRTRFGTLPVDKTNLLDFPEGLPGFEDLHQFILFREEDNDSILYLQSTEDPDVRLPLTSPHWFQVDYQVSLSDEEVKLLRMESNDEIAVLVTISEHGDQSSGLNANFHGPIILNTAKRVAMQKVLHEAHGSVVIQAH